MYIELNFEERKSGDWSIETFYQDGIKYQKLVHKGVIMMINTPEIVKDFEAFLKIGDGSILINGLGMGMCNVHFLKKETVTDLTVIEYNKELVDFIRPYFADEPRCTIIHADALTYEPPAGKRYDFVWHDIWTTQSASNVKNMDILFDKYKDITGWQSAWREAICREQYAERLARQKWIASQ